MFYIVRTFEEITQEVMDMTWQEGLSEIETFFDVDAYGEGGEAKDDAEQTLPATERDVEGHANTVDELNEEVQHASPSLPADQLSTPVERDQTAEPAFAQPEPLDHDGHPEVAPPSTPTEQPDDMEVDHVTAPPVPDDATESSHLDQPHFTADTATKSEEADHVKPTVSREEPALPQSIRPRNNSMNVSFIVNPQTEPQQPLTETEDLDEATLRVQEPPNEGKATSTAKSSPAARASSKPLPLRLAIVEASKTTEQPLVEDMNMTPDSKHHEAEPPSSDGKSSLIDEMRKEDENAYPGLRRLSDDIAVQQPHDKDDNETDDGESLADALSSPIGLQERLREAAEEEDDSEVDDEMSEAKDTPIEADPPAPEDSSDDVDAMVGGDEDVKMEDVKPDPEPAKKAMTRKAKGAVTRKKPEARATRPQTRKQVGKLAEANIAVESVPQPKQKLEPLTENTNAEANKVTHQQQALQAPKDDMSEDELASSSPQTVSRKRKAAPIKNDANDGDSTQMVKRAKTATILNENEAAPDTKDNITILPKQFALQEPSPAPDANAKKKRQTKAEIKEPKRPKKAATKKYKRAVGALELKGMTGSAFLAADDTGRGDGRGGGGGGRKTRAQIEAEKKAVPNAKEAVRARRKGA